MQVCFSQEVIIGLRGSANNCVCRVHGPWGFIDPWKFTEESPCHLLWAVLEPLSVTWPSTWQVGNWLLFRVPTHTPGSLWVRLKDMMISLNMVLMFVRVLIREVLNHLGWHLEERVVALFCHVLLLPASALMASSVSTLMGWLWLLTSLWGIPRRKH